MKMRNCARKTIILILFLLILVLIPWNPAFAQQEGYSGKLLVETEDLVVAGVPFDAVIKAVDEEGQEITDFSGPVQIRAENATLYHKTDQGKETLTTLNNFEEGVMKVEDLVIDKTGRTRLVVWMDKKKHQKWALWSYVKNVRVLPGILTILPPLLAIFLALVLRQVVISLFCGVWLGAAIIYDFNPFISFLRVLDTLLIKAIADSDHVSIIVFSLFLGGMVAVISRSGGSQGMVNIIGKWAKNPRSGQIATWAMGLVIFFDDYANTLIVGNSMRPLTDSLKISREKLSFLVDATAAPVTNIAIISTWIGFEIGVIGDSLEAIGVDREPYMVFLQTIPYRFYPILLLFFVFMVGYLMRDFGPMLAAEIRTRKTGKVLAPGAKPLSTIDEEAPEMKDVPERWYNAVAPILAVILFTIAGLWYSGVRGIIASDGAEALKGAGVFEILNNANSFNVLLWASFSGSLIAIIMVLSQKIMNLEDSINTWIEGAKSIMPAIIILSLAWSIGDICTELNTGGYLAQIARGNLKPQLLPFIIFTLSAVISFATGTSWGTMSIVMPIAVYVGHHLPPAGMTPGLKEVILLGSISGVLAGATFGDHCSPISDTTIMSSMASAADHIDHVRTQIPYALTVGVVGVLLGSIPTGFGLNPWISMVICMVVLFLIIRFLGKSPDDLAKQAEKG